MTANECINTFSNHLFWDVHKEDIDIDRHSKYIIKECWNMVSGMIGWYYVFIMVYLES